MIQVYRTFFGICIHRVIPEKEKSTKREKDEIIHEIYKPSLAIFVLLETSHISELKDVITSYNNLSFSDRIVFYTTISNDIAISDDTQSFLIETRLDGEGSCIYCEGMHVVKNGKRKDIPRRPSLPVVA